MSPSLVMTSTWWLDASRFACWRLIADAQHWPSWWRSAPELQGESHARPGQHRGGLWRALLGLPLRLQVRQRASSKGRLKEWQVGGDLQASMTWVLADAEPGGCDITCRWEIQSMFDGPDWWRAWTGLLLAHSHFRRMRACARDMGHASGCRIRLLREWSGRTHR